MATKPTFPKRSPGPIRKLDADPDYKAKLLEKLQDPTLTYKQIAVDLGVSVPTITQDAKILQGKAA